MSTIILQVLVTDLTKGTTVLRDMTAEELLQKDKDKLFDDAKKVADDAVQTAKDAARKAVLDKLGLTQDEAQALLG
jgi:hypothetical protein